MTPSPPPSLPPAKALLPSEIPPLIPAPGYLIVDRLQAPTQTEGGLVMPTQAQIRPNKGWVLRVTPAPECPSDLMPGDLVWFAAYGPTPLEHSSGTYELMAVRDVLAREARPNEA